MVRTENKTCVNEYITEHRRFLRTDCGVVETPSDIPPETLSAELWSNQIRRLHSDGFVHLRDLTHLDLNWNQISTIEEGSFNGLRKLTHLYLYGNRIPVIDPIIWRDLTSLQTLWLGRNPLDLTSESLRGLRRPLELVLNDPGDPDDRRWIGSRLCWLKAEEEAGTITWLRQGGRLFLPELEGDVEWDELRCGRITFL